MKIGTINLRTTIGLVTAALLMGSANAVIIWDNGNGDGRWDTAQNWDTNVLPVAGETVTINNGDTVITNDFDVPFNAQIFLSNSSGLVDTGGSVVRLNGADILVGAGSSLTGNFWDLDDATLTFEDGAIATMDHWEQKDENTFIFNLGAAGFSTLTPNFFRIGNGGTHNPGSIANATYAADLGAYVGGDAVITLVDFGTDAFGMDNAIFQGANFSILNAGPYTANFLWDDAAEAIQLNILAPAPVPEPGTWAAFLCLLVGIAGVQLKRRRCA